MFHNICIMPLKRLYSVFMSQCLLLSDIFFMHLHNTSTTRTLTLQTIGVTLYEIMICSHPASFSPPKKDVGDIKKKTATMIR